MSWRKTAASQYLGFGLGGHVHLGLCESGPGVERARIIGTIWFFDVSHFPTVQLNATVAEHWLYLARCGIFAFGGCAVDSTGDFSGPH